MSLISDVFYFLLTSHVTQKIYDDDDDPRVAEARIGETTERAETCIATVVLILIGVRQCLCVICKVVAQ